MANFNWNPNTKPGEVILVRQDISKELRGSGITSRDLAREETKAAKATNASLQTAARQQASIEALEALEQTARNEASVLTLQTPSTLEFDPSQEAALSGLLKTNVGCLIGSAGTGKTTVTKSFVNRLLGTISTLTLAQAGLVSANSTAAADVVYSILFCSFTGKAVQQLKRALPIRFHRNCMTIHSALEYAPAEEAQLMPDGTWGARWLFKPRRTAANKMRFTVYVIDEASMVPIPLFNELVEAMPPNSRIYLIGDINQLPPVQSRSVLPFAMLKWPTFELTTIHRQAADNPIIAAAHAILKGKFPTTVAPNFVIKPLPDGQLSSSTHTLKFIKAMHKQYLFNPLTDVLIVPTNKDTMGQLHLNEDLSKYFNPPETDAQGVVLNRRIPIRASRGSRLLAIRDKVMLLQNDNELGLTNGMTGVIVDITINGTFRGADKFTESGQFDLGDIDMSDIDAIGQLEASGSDGEAKDEKEDKDENQRQASHITTVRFTAVDGDKEVKLQTVGQYNKVAHAYALTCHKMQGGECPVVVISMHSSAGRMLSREWLYTAVTRAREKVVLLCNDLALLNALKNQAIKGNSIQEKANNFIALMANDDVTKPNLAEPQFTA